MKPERRAEVLSAGFKAAQEQMEKHPARPEYPHDYSYLYEWLEDKLYNLYEAMQLKQYRRIRVVSGEIIITACEIAEYTEPRLSGPKLPKRRRKKDAQ